MEEFDHIPTSSLRTYLSLLLMSHEQKKAILNARGLEYDPEFDPCALPMDDDDSDWSTEDEWDEEEDKARKAETQAKFEQMQKEYELREQRTAQMHQVRTHIDGKTIQARCVTGTANFYFGP